VARPDQSGERESALGLKLRLLMVTCCAVLAALVSVLRRMAQAANSIRGGVAKFRPHYRRPAQAKDTINMTRYSTVEIDFIADDPGIVRTKASRDS
jgi:hypothetical protein